MIKIDRDHQKKMVSKNSMIRMIPMKIMMKMKYLQRKEEHHKTLELP